MKKSIILIIIAELVVICGFGEIANFTLIPTNSSLLKSTLYTNNDKFPAFNVEVNAELRESNFDSSYFPLFFTLSEIKIFNEHSKNFLLTYFQRESGYNSTEFFNYIISPNRIIYLREHHRMFSYKSEKYKDIILVSGYEDFKNNNYKAFFLKESNKNSSTVKIYNSEKSIGMNVFINNGNYYWLVKSDKDGLSAILVRTNENLKILNEKTLFSCERNAAHISTFLSNGNIFIIANYLPTDIKNKGTRYTTIFCYNLVGNMLWKKYFFHSVGRNLIYLKNSNSYLFLRSDLLGSENSYGYTNSKIRFNKKWSNIITEISKTGQILQTYDIEKNTDEEALKIQKLNNGSYIIFTETPVGGNDPYFIELLFLNKNLKPTKKLTIKPEYYSIIPIFVENTSSDYILYGITNYYDPDGYYNPCIIHIKSIKEKWYYNSIFNKM
jgi:hypothetical protein